jgi:hypothetical protein
VSGNNNGGSDTNNISIKTGGASQSHSNPTNIIIGITVPVVLLVVLGFSW